MRGLVRLQLLSVQLSALFIRQAFIISLTLKLQYTVNRSIFSSTTNPVSRKADIPIFDAILHEKPQKYILLS